MSLAKVERPGDALAAIELASAMIQRAETVKEVVGLMDDAKALRAMAELVDQTGYLTRRCSELWLRAQRKAGGLLADAELPDGRPNGDSVSPLKALGIERHQSSRWQRIASVPDEMFERYIEDAIDAQREVTASALLGIARELAGSNPVTRPPLHLVRTSDVPGLPGLVGQFGAIVADPPWQYDNKSTRNAAAKHYPTMTVEELCDLSVEAHAAPQSHLYLWTTNQFLRVAFEVMEAWGFEYKAHLVWVKPQMGMGNYFRISHEHVLFGVRGGLRTNARNLMSWFEAPRQEHSRKPDTFLDTVETASPGPYLELFSRRKRLGWQAWGNEA